MYIIEENNIKQEVQDLISRYAKLHKNQHYDNIVIMQAKEYAKKHDLKYQDVLKLFKPTHEVKATLTWDKKGYLKPQK